MIELKHCGLTDSRWEQQILVNKDTLQLPEGELMHNPELMVKRGMFFCLHMFQAANAEDVLRCEGARIDAGM